MLLREAYYVHALQHNTVTVTSIYVHIKTAVHEIVLGLCSLYKQR
jgi:hypothetical protein